MLLVKSAFSVLLGLGLASQLYAQGPGDGWVQVQDNDVEPRVKTWREWAAPDKGWLQDNLDNDVEPYRTRTIDGRVALKALLTALFRYKKLKALKTQALESVTKGKYVPTAYSLSMKPDITTSSMRVDSPATPRPPAPHHLHHNVHHMMENDKSHRFTHSIRSGYGAALESLL